MYYQNKIKKLSNKLLIYEFHQIPKKQVIYNVLTILTFVLALLTLSSRVELALCFMAIGCIIVLLQSKNCPRRARIFVAMELKSRYPKDLNTKNVYDYVIATSNDEYGKYRYSNAEEVLAKIDSVLNIITFLIYIFYSFYLLVIFLMIGLFIYFICFMIQIVVRTSVVHRIQNLAFVPFNFVFKTLVSSFGKSSSGVYEDINTSKVKHSGLASQPEEMDSDLSILQLRSFIYQKNYEWLTNFDLSIDSNVIYVRGTQEIYRPNDPDIVETGKFLTQQTEAKIRRDLSEQIRDFYATYPNVEHNIRVNININIIVKN